EDLGDRPSVCGAPRYGQSLGYLHGAVPPLSTADAAWAGAMIASSPTPTAGRPQAGRRIERLDPPASLHAFPIAGVRLLPLQLGCHGSTGLPVLVHSPFGLERVLIDEGVGHVVHVGVLVGLQVGRVSELECDLVPFSIAR